LGTPAQHIKCSCGILYIPRYSGQDRCEDCTKKLEDEIDNNTVIQQIIKKEPPMSDPKPDTALLIKKCLDCPTEFQQTNRNQTRCPECRIKRSIDKSAAEPAPVEAPIKKRMSLPPDVNAQIINLLTAVQWASVTIDGPGVSITVNKK
jgi:DNA-directed RNA polymerase subunit RPC12/RpoP